MQIGSIMIRFLSGIFNRKGISPSKIDIELTKANGWIGRCVGHVLGAKKLSIRTGFLNG